MVLESTQQNVKRGRGRPRKNPQETISHVSSSSENPSRGAVSQMVSAASRSTKKKTPHAVARSLTWEEELEAFERHSNKSGVLTLLVLLLGIALIGYGMYLKLQQNTPVDEQHDQKIPVQQAQQGAQTNEQQNPVAETPQPNPQQYVPAGKEADLIVQYFTHLTKGQTDEMVALEDTSFTTVASLKNRYNIDRLSIFIKNTTDGITIQDMVPAIDDAVMARNPLVTAYDFTMMYTLKPDGKVYRDAWRGYLVKKPDGTIRINGFLYTGKDASQSPFFQFQTFGIK